MCNQQRQKVGSVVVVGVKLSMVVAAQYKEEVVLEALELLRKTTRHRAEVQLLRQTYSIVFGLLLVVVVHTNNSDYILCNTYLCTTFNCGNLNMVAKTDETDLFSSLLFTLHSFLPLHFKLCLRVLKGHSRM